jgi:hypothetical protein
MVFSKSAWIHFGAGRLYGPPFLTRCLLYRLHDINCSILVYHKPNVTSGSYVVTKKGSATITEMKSVCHAVTEVYVHHVNSSTTALTKLVNSPPIQFNLSNTSNPRWVFGEIEVSLELLNLPCKEMFCAFPGRGRQFEQQISETAYWVRGPVVVDDLGKKLEQQSGTAQDTKMPCWKISMGDHSRREYYDLSTPREWGLSALRVEEPWKVVSAVYLEKRGLQSSRAGI